MLDVKCFRSTRLRFSALQAFVFQDICFPKPFFRFWLRLLGFRVLRFGAWDSGTYRFGTRKKGVEDAVGQGLGFW